MYSLLTIHIKQKFLDLLSLEFPFLKAASKFADLPSHRTSLLTSQFTHPETLEAFYDMTINLQTGGGIYAYQDHDLNFLVLYSGANGSLDFRRQF